MDQGVLQLGHRHCFPRFGNFVFYRGHNAGRGHLGFGIYALGDGQDGAKIGQNSRDLMGAQSGRQDV